MKKLSLTLTLLVVALAVTAQRSYKRGFGENNLGYMADMRVLAQGCTWWYNWGYTGSTVHDQFVSEGGDIEFIPMTWNGGYDINKLREYYQQHPQAKTLLGFNEPNFADQSNMTPAEAAEKWPALEQLAQELGLTLVAPALNIPPGPIHDGVKYSKEEWMDGFIQAYKDQNGGREPHYDYLALHCYMDQPSATIEYVEQFAQRYQKQVWLTEFCSWEDRSLTPATQRAQMIRKLTLLEKSQWVGRYAWFKARNSNTYPYYNLVEYPNTIKGIPAGTLTDVGFAYVHMSTFNADKYYQPGEVIPVNEFIDQNNLTEIQWGLDPLTRDSVELGMQGNSVSVSYQVEVPSDATYKLLLRAARPSGSASLKARINILDETGATLVSKYTMEPGQDTLTYVAYVLDLPLKAGKHTLTIAKDNARACNLSLIKLMTAVSDDDPDLAAQTGVARTVGKGTVIDDGPSTGGNTQTWHNDNVRVSDATTEPYKFADGEKYYAVYLDAETRKKAGIADADYVNMGDNGTTQNSYNWESTFTYADVTGANSFGVTGNYTALVVGEKGWSGLGYSVNGGLDLSGLDESFSLHMALKSQSDDPLLLYFNDDKGHSARLFFGDGWMTEIPQGAQDEHKFIPIANFPRDGRWYNVDIPMSYLKGKFGLDFTGSTDYHGNIFCISGGGKAGTDVAYDAVFFHAPKDSVAVPVTPNYDMTVTDAEKEPFRFSSSDRYYLIYLDGNTKQSELSEKQIVDCGPNGANRQLYPWNNTFTFPAASDENSFGVGSAYMNCKVGAAGWSGLGYFVGGSSQPLNLTGITDDFTLHFAVKTKYTGIIEFELIDAMGNGGWIVLGDGDENTTFEGHKLFGNFPRDGRWYNIEVPLKKLNNEWAVNFSTAVNFTGNLFCFLAGGVENTEVGVDAIFIYGPEELAAEAERKGYDKLDDRQISIAKATDNPFTFPDDQAYDYYVIFLDSESQSKINKANLHYLGDNGSTQNVYPWDGTLVGADATGENSFGVTGSYAAWLSTDKGWLGLGHNIAPKATQDLSGITADYTLHFAVKSTSKINYHYTVIDGNGRSAYLNLGPNDAWEDNAAVKPIGDFERDNTWYNVDVPVSYLVRQGLDYTTCNVFRAGNIFNITAQEAKDGDTLIEAIHEGIPVDYDAVFFYGPAKVVTAVSQPVADEAPTATAVADGVYDLHGRRVAATLGASLPKGLYVVRSAAGTKKVFVK